MPRPGLLVIHEWPDGVFLLAVTAAGAFAGDTWHRSVEAAKAQAAYEYGADLRWTDTPASETDPVGYAVRVHAASA
jgi:hypothetical protein